MPPKLFTLSQLADRLNVSSHRVKYAIDTHGVRPVTRIGIIRVWGEEAIPKIEGALRSIARNKGRRAVEVEA